MLRRVHPQKSFLRVLAKDSVNWLTQHFPQADLAILPGSLPQTSPDWLRLAAQGETSISWSDKLQLAAASAATSDASLLPAILLEGGTGYFMVTQVAVYITSGGRWKMRIKAQSASTKGWRKQEVKKLRSLFELLSGICSSAIRYGSRLIAFQYGRSGRCRRRINSFNGTARELKCCCCLTQRTCVALKAGCLSQGACHA